MIAKKHTLMCLATVCLLSGSLALCLQLRKSQDAPDLQDMLDMPKTAMQLHLYSANKDPKTGKSISGMTFGYDYRSPDGRTIVRSRNEYETGQTEDVFYRSDETKEWSRDFYPLRPGQTLPVLRSIARFAEDGKTYVSHDVKREDGTIERQGRLLPDGNYEQRYICTDGKTPEKIQLFDKSKRFISEQAVFCQTGRPIREVIPGEYGKQLTLFNPDGSVAVKLNMEYSPESGAYITGDVFSATGEVQEHYASSGFGASLDIFGSAGRLEQSWQDNPLGNTVELTVYDQSTPWKIDAKTNAQVDPRRKLFTQTWKLREDYKPTKGVFLVKVVEYDAEGKEARRIEMNGDGSTPAKIVMPTQDPAKSLAYILDASGKQVLKSILQEANKPDIEQPLPADTNVRIAGAELESYKMPAKPEWDDGNTSTAEKVYDFH